MLVDEVICSLGRPGHPFSSIDRFGVVPDIITTAKSMANGTIPMGAVFSSREIYDTFLTATEDRAETLVEFFHGDTFGANPAACAAAHACIDICEREVLYTRVQSLESYWQDTVHKLKGLPHVLDIRNLGFMAGIDIAPMANSLPGQRTLNLFRACFDNGLLTRANGETLARCPPLTVDRSHIDQMIGIVSDQLKAL